MKIAPGPPGARRRTDAPTHAFNYYLQLQKLRCWQDAIAVLERGLPAVAEPAMRVAFLRGLSYAHAERAVGAAALAAAEQALPIDERSIGARYLRGRARALRGRLEEAMADIQQVLATDPANADANPGDRHAGTRWRPQREAALVVVLELTGSVATPAPGVPA
jgi:tetratricopeptide (TPR) repeat protein